MLLAAPPRVHQPLIVRATERALEDVEAVERAKPRPMVEYQGRSRAFMHEVLGFRPWADLATDVVPKPPAYCSTQAGICDAIDDPNVREIDVRSGKGPGKTQLFAGAFEYEEQCFEDTIFITLAPTFRQVREQLWRNIAALHESARRALNGRLLDVRLDIGPKWFGMGLSTNKPEKLAGFHGATAVSQKYRDRPDLWDKISDAEYFELLEEELRVQQQRIRQRGGRVVVGVDEASGIDDRLEPAIDGLLTNPGSRLYRFGNPSRTHGRFFMCFHSNERTEVQQDEHETVQAEGQRCFTLDARTAPAAIVDRVHLTRMATLCSPNPEKNPVFQVDVMGIHPTSSEDNVYPYALLEDATRSNPLVGGLHMGVDTARHGGDRCVAYLFDRGHICGVHRWADKGQAKPDTIASAAIITACMQKWKVRPEHVHVDVTGNWGIYDVLWANKVPVDGVNFGQGAQGDWGVVLGRGPFLRNRRNELHWVLLRLLQEGLLTIPNTALYAPLWSDLTQILKKKAGLKLDEWAVEAKIDFKARTGRSCDDSDGVLCCLSRTMANRVRFSTLRRRAA